MTKTQNINIELSNMLQLIKDFTDLLDLETKALRSSNFSLVDEIQSEKRTMADRYAHQIELLQQLKSENQTAKDSLKEQIILARTKFTETLKSNLTTLDAVKLSSKRIMDKIIDAARESVEEKNVYTPNGFYSSERNTPISIDSNI